MMALETEIMF